MCQKQQCMQALLWAISTNEYAGRTRFQKRKFHFNHINFLNKNMCIEDAKVIELVYSGNTVMFLFTK